MVVSRYWVAAVFVVAFSGSRADEVVVAVPLSMQPYFLPIAGGGLAYDTIRAAFAVGGYDVRPLYVSSQRIHSLISGDSRAECIPMVSPGFEHGWSTSARIRLLHFFAITRPGTKVSGVEDLKDKRVLGYAGAMMQLGEEFRSAMQENPQYREVHNHRAQVRLLLQGRAEVIVSDRLLVSWYMDYLREEGATDTKLLFHDLFEPTAQEFICRHQELAAAFSAGLAKVLEDGTLSTILAKYGKDEADTLLLPLTGVSAGQERMSSPPAAAPE